MNGQSYDSGVGAAILAVVPAGESRTREVAKIAPSEAEEGETRECRAVLIPVKAGIVGDSTERKQRPVDGVSGEGQCLRDSVRRGVEATGLAHGPVVARIEGHASGAKGRSVVADTPRTPVGTRWPSHVGVNECVEPSSDPGGLQMARSIAWRG